MLKLKKGIKVSINNNSFEFISFDQIENSNTNINLNNKLYDENLNDKQNISGKNVSGKNVSGKNISINNEYNIFCDDDDGFKITCQKNRHTLFRAECEWDKKNNVKINIQNPMNQQNTAIRDINEAFMKKLIFANIGNILNEKNENDLTSIDTSDLSSSNTDIDSLDSSDSSDSLTSTDSFKLSSSISFNFGHQEGTKNKKNKKQEVTKERDTFEEQKKNYTKCMNDIVEQIKKMSWGQTIAIDPDPLYISLNKKRLCYITKIVRFSSYEFRGYGSKKILRYFMNKTYDDPLYGYQKIIQILDGKSRTFLPIKNWEDFWKAYEDEPLKDRHLFELIRSDQPCKPYLDIEWYAEEQQIDKQKFIKMLSADLIKIFKNRYNIEITKNDIMIATSHSETKTSFHVVIDKMIDGNTVGYKTNRRGYADSAWDLWVALIEHNEVYKDVIDKSVYSTDREFRAIFSNKGIDFRPFIPYTTSIETVNPDSCIDTESSLCMRYIITYSPNNQYHHIQTPEVSTKYSVINKKYYEHDFIPQYYTDKKVNELIKLIKPMHPTVSYTGRSSCGTGWRFSYANKNELCYTGNAHDSNGFYVFENEKKGIIYMKCMSDSCKGYHVLKKYSVNNVIDKKLF